ncbi:uncharacterized protein LOC144702285 [Wolffia australiana]|uniref:Uncharacterized protein n=1 Tax=Wolffia australiana TaxID=161112 RepID=H6UGY4_WOLAU|nr:hypothetical protein [Wolffia australiana]
MNWISRKIYLYNVTMGLYMLDWWEKCLFNILISVLLWFICYNTWRSTSEFFNSRLLSKLMTGGNFGVGDGKAT